MRNNACTKIIGPKVILVPYKKKHVEKYHLWMKDEELQDLTASEPLTLQDEYYMQDSWFQDDDKCTFIILDKERMLKTNDEIGAMIGDVNLYLNDIDDPKVAEIEVMIADPANRLKGKGKDALLLMMRYGIETLQLHKFIAKIKAKNEISIHLFNAIGFRERSKSEVFQEIEMVFEVKDLNDLLLKVQNYEIKEY